jgi:hypothetical protein
MSTMAAYEQRCFERERKHTTFPMVRDPPQEDASNVIVLARALG